MSSPLWHAMNVVGRLVPRLGFGKTRKTLWLKIRGRYFYLFRPPRDWYEQEIDYMDEIGWKGYGK